jgi:hypothetical protein
MDELKELKMNRLADRRSGAVITLLSSQLTCGGLPSAAPRCQKEPRNLCSLSFEDREGAFGFGCGCTFPKAASEFGGRSQPVHVDPGDQLEAGDGHHEEDLEDQGGSLHHAVTR